MRKERYTMFDRLRFPDIDDPEQMRNPILAIDLKKCGECGLCVNLCVMGNMRTDTVGKYDFLARTAQGGKYGVPRLEISLKGANRCFACFACGAACPGKAIKIEQNYSPGYHFKRISQSAEMSYPVRY